MIDIDYYVEKIKKNKFVIFLFHGVIVEEIRGIKNYTNKHILKSDFENLMINLKKNGTPICLNKLIEHYESNEPLPEFSFSITFDDGFENNFSIAIPVLEKLSLPATFYVSTNLVDKNLMTWIDQIEYCFESTEVSTIKLPWKNNSFELSNDKKKIYCLDNIRKNVKTKMNSQRINQFVRYVFEKCKVTPLACSDNPEYKKMNWDQVSSINKHDLFQIGGHSHSHFSLGMLNEKDMIKEITDSITMLRRKADVISEHYSYPE